MHTFRFQYQFEGKGLENNFGRSVKQSDNKNKNEKIAAKIQDGCHFRITHHNFCGTEHRTVILVFILRFACMSNGIKITYIWLEHIFSYIESYFQENACTVVAWYISLNNAFKKKMANELIKPLHTG